MNKKERQSKLTGLFFITAAAIMAAPTMLATAQGAPVTHIEGKGTGTMTCGDGTTPSVTIYFSVDKKFNTKDFNGRATIFNEFFDQKNINIYSGKVGKSGFTLLGIEDFNNLCPGDYTPSKATITGQCLEGTTITYTAVNGEKSSFPNSSVVCSSIR